MGGYDQAPINHYMPIDSVTEVHVIIATLCRIKMMVMPGMLDPPSCRELTIGVVAMAIVVGGDCGC